MRYLYSFPSAKLDGNEDRSTILGNKGAQLAKMARMGLPVPPGFTISIPAFQCINSRGQLPLALRSQVNSALDALGKSLGFEFGSTTRPLLVSVRSAPPVPMPGIMTTLSNVGLTTKTLNGLSTMTGDRRFAYDTFRRLIETYARTVMVSTPQIRGSSAYRSVSPLGVQLERILEKYSEDRLSELDLSRICDEYLTVVESISSKAFPDDPSEQLWDAINAVYQSWHSKHAFVFRERMGIPHDLGTAVIVQAMVFGNLGKSSGAGVLFTRDPLMGRPEISGEWLPNSQGEDIMDGNLMPYPLRSTSTCCSMNEGVLSLEESLPLVFNSLVKLAKLLTEHHREPQEVEFTVQEGRLWILQSRSLNLNRPAALKIAIDMVRQGLITTHEALERTTKIALEDAMPWKVATSAAEKQIPIAQGLPASGGVASGIIALTTERAEEFSLEGKRVVFIGDHLKPEDISGISVADALVTNKGGIASHVAATARGLDKVCVVGCKRLNIDVGRKVLLTDHLELREGDEVTVDGNSGLIYGGYLQRQKINGEFAEYVSILKEWRRTSGTSDKNAPTVK